MILNELFHDKEKYFTIIKEMWNEAPDTFFDISPKVSDEDKETNEQYIRSMIVTFQKQIKNFPRIPIGRKKWKKNTFHMLNEVLKSETIINLHNCMDSSSLDAFEAELIEFLQQVRQFAPELSFIDIGQAIRNYIVYAMFKKLHNVNAGFSRAGFGYSMLYPFTDNFIDNKTCTPRDKQEYNQLIRDQIKGITVHPITSHQKKTCELLMAIESDYPRKEDATIYPLLLMMLDAQELSLKQQSMTHAIPYEERLDITLYKGGISVLIDRFFAKNELTEADLFFYLGFGFFLQLADDLQDIKEDSLQGNSSIFTIDFNLITQEKIVNKLLHFFNNMITQYQAENNSFQEFIRYASNLLIISSALGSKEFFSLEYISNMEPYLPVSYPFLEQNKNLKIGTMDESVNAKYMKILDALIR